MKNTLMLKLALCRQWLQKNQENTSLQRGVYALSIHFHCNAVQFLLKISL